MGVEHVALPRLACCVDVTMCRFRIEVASLPLSSDAFGEIAPPQSSDRIRRKTMGANSRYRRALSGSALTLAQSASGKRERLCLVLCAEEAASGAQLQRTMHRRELRRQWGGVRRGRSCRRRGGTSLPERRHQWIPMRPPSRQVCREGSRGRWRCRAGYRGCALTLASRLRCQRQEGARAQRVFGVNGCRNPYVSHTR